LNLLQKLSGELINPRIVTADVATEYVNHSLLVGLHYKFCVCVLPPL